MFSQFISSNDALATLGKMYTQTSTLTDVTAGKGYNNQASVSVPEGKYIIIREVYRSGSFNDSTITLRVGTSTNAGGNVKSATMNNSILQHISYLCLDAPTDISTCVVIDAVSTTGQTVIVRTTAIKIG